MTLTNTIITVPLVEGASEELTRLMSVHYEDMVDVQYTTYVDTMGHTAVPMLVAIVTTVPEDEFPVDPNQLALWDDDLGYYEEDADGQLHFQYDEPQAEAEVRDNEEGDAAWYLFGDEEHNGRTE